MTQEGAADSYQTFSIQSSPPKGGQIARQCASQPGPNERSLTNEAHRMKNTIYLVLAVAVVIFMIAPECLEPGIVACLLSKP